MYTIISYRKNGEIYRGGYCEGRTDSEFDIFTTGDKGEAISLLGRTIVKSRIGVSEELNKDSDFTNSADISLGIDGYFGYAPAMSYVDDETHERYSDEEAEIWEAANNLADKLFQEELEEERLRKQKEAAEAMAKQQKIREDHERRQLAELKKKYEGTDNE